MKNHWAYASTQKLVDDLGNEEAPGEENQMAGESAEGVMKTGTRDSTPTTARLFGFPRIIKYIYGSEEGERALYSYFYYLHYLFQIYCPFGTIVQKKLEVEVEENCEWRDDQPRVTETALILISHLFSFFQP